MHNAYLVAKERNLSVHVGNVLSSDRFYNEELDKQKLADYGVLAVEMEVRWFSTCWPPNTTGKL